METLLQRHFATFQTTRSPTSRDAIIASFTPLARTLARRYARPGGEPLEDLQQVALVGLVKAVDRFDPERGYAFASYATPTILGELRRHFRGLWDVHLPRQVQEDVQLVEKTMRALSAQTGRSATTSELVEATGLEPERVLEALVASRAAHTRSLEATLGDEDDDDQTPVSTHIGRVDPGFDAVEYGAGAGPAFRKMSTRDQEIVRLRFVSDLTQSEIARRVGISQMQVSRVLSARLRELREAAGSG